MQVDLTNSSIGADRKLILCSHVSVMCRLLLSANGVPPGFSPRALLAFRRQYPDGENFVVAHDVDRSFTNNYNGIQLQFVNLDELIAEIHPPKR